MQFIAIFFMMQLETKKIQCDKFLCWNYDRDSAVVAELELHFSAISTCSREKKRFFSPNSPISKISSSSNQNLRLILKLKRTVAIFWKVSLLYLFQVSNPIESIFNSTNDLFFVFLPWPFHLKDFCRNTQEFHCIKERFLFLLVKSDSTWFACT